METLTVSYPLPFVNSNHGRALPWFPLGFPRMKRFALMKKARVLIRAPPMGFDYRTEMTEESRSAVEAAQPELMDLVDEGILVLVEKRRFGPVPEWRREFVAPEAIWLVGTSHLSRKSAADVERVIRALKPDNVVVELCRSRQVLQFMQDTEIDGGPFQLYEQLCRSYPSLLLPLVYERDMYLDWSLKRSKAVNNSKRAVGVIGKGHMNGVVYALISDQGNLRFRDLAGSNLSAGPMIGLVLY
ncbi:hypothetical protein KSP40_PGU011728 [Platanthera guangdongensis]|uniref:TraB domain-containing protein n=1 Tax=Platanthera guangdongensis TaxID=2320717 RepID=A0ABR2MF65_9ASPA